MDAKDTTIVSFRASAEELVALDSAAAEAGLNRADYIRSRVFEPDTRTQLIEVEKQLNLLTDQLGRAAEAQNNHTCSNPDHARIYGVGHCFDCNLPIASRP